MLTRIIRIGNSKGIVLPKTLLDRYGIKENVELIMKESHLEVIPVKPPRHGWDKAYKEMHQKGHDRLLLDELPDDDILEEWK